MLRLNYPEYAKLLVSISLSLIPFLGGKLRLTVPCFSLIMKYAAAEGSVNNPGFAPCAGGFIHLWIFLKFISWLCLSSEGTPVACISWLYLGYIAYQN